MIATITWLSFFLSGRCWINQNWTKAPVLSLIVRVLQTPACLDWCRRTNPRFCFLLWDHGVAKNTFVTLYGLCVALQSQTKVLRSPAFAAWVYLNRIFPRWSFSVFPRQKPYPLRPLRQEKEILDYWSTEWINIWSLNWDNSYPGWMLLYW